MKNVERDGMDRDIEQEEVEDAIFRLRTGISPGPDEFFSEFFENAGESFIKAITELINIIWKKGELPSQWKTAHIKFLRKTGKTD